jgi:hypothetical protein
VDRVHGAVDRRRARVHGGPRAARTLGAAVPCRRAGARAHRSSPTGRNRERGTRETRWAAHRGAGGSVAAGRRR